MNALTDSLACLECRERAGYLRGLCPRCYNRLGAGVRAGETSWRRLEEAGRARPPRTVWGTFRPAAGAGVDRQGRPAPRGAPA